MVHMETSCKQQCQCTDRNIILLSTAMLTVEIASKALSDAKENLKKLIQHTENELQVAKTMLKSLE